jgi:hypothetical protein
VVPHLRWTLCVCQSHLALLLPSLVTRWREVIARWRQCGAVEPRSQCFNWDQGNEVVALLRMGSQIAEFLLGLQSMARCQNSKHIGKMLNGFERDIILSRAHCTTLVCFYDLWWSSLCSGKLHYQQNVTTCDQIKLWAAKSGFVSCSNLTCKKVPETIKLQDFGLWPKFEWLVYQFILSTFADIPMLDEGYPPMFCWNLSNCWPCLSCWATLRSFFKAQGLVVFCWWSEWIPISGHFEA